VEAFRGLGGKGRRSVVGARAPSIVARSGLGVIEHLVLIFLPDEAFHHPVYFVHIHWYGSSGASRVVQLVGRRITNTLHVLPDRQFPSRMTVVCVHPPRLVHWSSYPYSRT